MEEKNIYEELIKDEDTLKVVLPIGVEVEIKNDMTIDEKTAFVERVLSGIFIGEDEDFYPEYVEPVFEICVLQMLTDVPVFEDEDGENVDIEKTYKLCKVLNLQKTVDDVKFKKLVSELDDLVYEKINYKKEIVLAGERRKLEVIRQEMEDGLILINNMIEQLNNTMQESINLNDYFDEVVKLNESIEGMNKEDVVGSILEYRNNN